jgi:hypothetical protein
MKFYWGMIFLSLVLLQACTSEKPREKEAGVSILQNDDEWEALQAKLEGYYSVYDKPVASLSEVNTIPDAPICGGGKLTVALDGSHCEVNYHFSKSDFWVLVMHPERLYQRHSIRPAPLARLGMTVHNAAADARGLQHVQDMAKAELRSVLPLKGGKLNVRCAALAQRDIVVYEFDAVDTPASLTVRIKTNNEHNNFFILEGANDEQTVWLRKEHASSIDVNAALAMRAVGASQVRTHYEDGAVAALSFDVTPGQTTHLLLSVKGGNDEYKHLEESIAALDGVDGSSVPGMLADHQQWWKEYWLKSHVNLQSKIIERYYYGALYVLGSSIDLDSRVMPGLAGGWITAPEPKWGGTYTMNYNGEAPFWSLFSANRGELIMPYARVCNDFIPTGRSFAKRLDTRGIVMPVMIGPWGTVDNGDPVGQKSNASLAAMSLIWHCEYYRDRAFLEQYAYPYLLELMDFWEDNLEFDERGRCVIKGAQREHDPGDLNPGPTLGYVRKILESMIAFSRELDLDKDRRGKWQNYLEHLSDYPVAVVDGKLLYKEAENRINISMFGKRDNPVMLDHVYPGGALDRAGSEGGRMIARNTLHYMDSWNQANGFSRIFSQAVRAGYPGDELLDLFKARITHGEGPHEILRKNNTFINDDHSFEGVGGIEFINSMLANAHGGVLKVFDVWPEERDASFERLRVQGAFLISGELKNGVVSRVEVQSEKGGPCRMQSCWKGQSIAVEKITFAGVSSVKVSRVGDSYSWDTDAGALYHVTPGSPVKEKDLNPPVLLVPLIDSAAQKGSEYTSADLDVLLTSELRSTKFELELVRVDETKRNCTAECRFSSRDKQVATVDAKGTIHAVGTGWTSIDISAEIDGVGLHHVLSVYVLNKRVIPGVVATAEARDGWGHAGWMNSPDCLVGASGIDGPDLSALHRANSYRVGSYTVRNGEDAKVLFDLGSVYALDEMWIWNYNCPDNFRVLWWSGGTASGMRDVAIEYSLDDRQWNSLKTQGYPFRLARASGKMWMPATNLDNGKNSPVKFQGGKARYVRITADATKGVGNWGGPVYGLSEVRFTYMDESKK